MKNVTKVESKQKKKANIKKKNKYDKEWKFRKNTKPQQHIYLNLKKF